MSSVLVTGATSLLGRSVAQALIDRGEDVIVAQRRPSGLDCREVLGDLADPSVATRAVRAVDAIVHLAAKVDVVGDPVAFHRVNVGGTHNLLRAAAAAAVGRFVQVSSPSVAHMGTSIVGAGAGPADPTAARGNYAITKARAELLALEAGRRGPLSVVAIRPHLIWGPGDTQLVGRIVDRARAGRLAFIGNGAALVDATYVDNATAALVAALDRAASLAGRSLVVSDGTPRPIGEMIERICAAAGVAPPTRRVPRTVARSLGLLVDRWWQQTGRTDDPPMTAFLAEQLSTAHWFDQRETRALLDWVPHVDLDEGFRRLASSYQRHGT